MLQSSDLMVLDDSSEVSEEEINFDLKACTEYLKRIKIVQEEFNQLGIVRSVFPVLKIDEEWNEIRDEKIEHQLLIDVPKFICSPEHVDELITMSEVIDLYFNVLAESTSICLMSHTQIVKSIEGSYEYYVALSDDSRYSSSNMIYENIVLVNQVKYLVKVIGEMSKYARGQSRLDFQLLFMKGIEILDKFLLKLLPNQRILTKLNTLLVDFSIDMFHFLLPPFEELKRDVSSDICAVICGTLSKIYYIRQIAHSFVSLKFNELKNQQNKQWNAIFQLSIMIGLFTCTGYDEFLFSHLQHENELVSYTCIWSLGVVCEDKNELLTKLQHLFVIDNRGSVKRSILNYFTIFVTKDEGVGTGRYDSIFNILPDSVIRDLRSKSNESLNKTWYLMSLIIRKSQNRGLYVYQVIELLPELEKSMSLQCSLCNGYLNVDPKFKKIHAVYFKLLSDKKFLKYIKARPMTTLILRESVFVSLKRMVFSAKTVDRKFIENLESYLGLIVGLMDSEMISYMKKEQYIVTKCLFKVNDINKNMGNSFHTLISQLGVDLESFLTIEEIGSLLTKRMLHQIPKKIAYFSKVEDVLELLFILNSIGDVLRTFGSRISQTLALKESFIESLERSIIDIIQSKLLLNRYRTVGKSVDVYVMVKSVLCNMIAKIYCYCDQGIVLKNFKKLRETILFFPELPHLRMGLEQLEYFASLVDILEHVTNTEERIDFDFLQNGQLLDRTVSILHRFKNATDAFYFRSELGVVNEGESLTRDWKMLVIRSMRLKILLETQKRDLENA